MPEVTHPIGGSYKYGHVYSHTTKRCDACGTYATHWEIVASNNKAMSNAVRLLECDACGQQTDNPQV